MAVNSGQFAEATDHYEHHGQREARTADYTGATHEFDELFYLRKYSDVAQLVADGAYRSGAHHFWKRGRVEGREKNPANYDVLKPIELDALVTKGRELGSLARRTPLVH